jgi:hypothetical protein
MTFKERVKDILANPYLISSYANRKCKICLGKGVEERDIDEGFGLQPHRILCECVKKAIRKEINV